MQFAAAIKKKNELKLCFLSLRAFFQTSVDWAAFKFKRQKRVENDAEFSTRSHSFSFHHSFAELPLHSINPANLTEVLFAD